MIMKIDCISDLHGYLPKLEGGDLLIIAGDMTARDTEEEWVKFEHWLTEQNYEEKIIIAGNHDNFLKSMDEDEMWQYWCRVRVTYLCDSFTEFRGLKIWGSPWSLWFHGINPKCKTFTGSENDLQKKYDLIPNFPDFIDILITHGPPFGTFDSVSDWHDGTPRSVGCKALNKVVDRIKPQLHVFGHIHEHGGQQTEYLHENGEKTIYVNASIVNERYEHVNKPVRIIL
jgi:Icc-related predicted phosphoesterase